MKNIKLFDSIIINEFMYTIVEILDENKCIVEEHNGLTEEIFIKTMLIETFNNYVEQGNIL